MLTIKDSTQRYLEQIRIPLRLGCVSDTGHPVVLSLWFLFEDGRFYCATQESARVVGYLRREPRCAFEVAGDQPPYCGVRGQGIATLDTERGLDVLERLLVRYLGGTEQPLAQKLLSRDTPEVAIVIEPLTLHTWDFADRMRSSLSGQPPEKLCP